MVPYLRAANVKDGELDLRDVKMMNFTPEEQAVFSLREGDVLVTEGSGSLASVGASTVWRGELSELVCFQNTLIRLRPRSDRTDGGFLGWWARHAFVDGLFASIANGANIYHISAERVRDLHMGSPPVTEQRAIAGFLDTETARIDTLIDKKRRMIQLLAQRVVAIGSIAAWGEDHGDRVSCTAIGPVETLPREWSVLRNKVFMREINDRSPEGTEELLSVSHLTGVTPRSQKNVTMFMAESLIGYKLVQPGDLVINTMWAWMGAAGVSPVAGIVSPAYGVYRFDQRVVLPAFYDIVVRTPAYVTEMTRFSRGVWTSRLRLYPDEFLRLSAPVPSLSVQSEIVERVVAASSHTSRTVALQAAAIDLLTKRRQALITAAVTGELDVARPIAEEAL